MLQCANRSHLFHEVHPSGKNLETSTNLAISGVQPTIKLQSCSAFFLLNKESFREMKLKNYCDTSGIIRDFWNEYLETGVIPRICSK